MGERHIPNRASTRSKAGDNLVELGPGNAAGNSTMTNVESKSEAQQLDQDALLEKIQHRVLWLSTQMVFHANKSRANPDGTKVGGHHASCASVVTVLPYLYFEHMRAGD